jgi:hypothetical protein
MAEVRHPLRPGSTPRGVGSGHCREMGVSGFVGLRLNENLTECPPSGGIPNTFEGFDPGSERTLAAWIRHASRANPSNGGSGVRGSKAWMTYPGIGDSPSRDGVIPDDVATPKLRRPRRGPRGIS